MSRVSVFGVKYSPNLGDGLIADCLEYALKQAGVGEVKPIDLAGRTATRRGSGLTREALLDLLAPIPPELRGLLLRPLLEGMAALSWRPHYRLLTDLSDAVIIGGGNLFADFDLNFPIKLASALSIARARSMKVIIAGVGVSPKWSTVGRDLLFKALARTDVRSVFVRDQPSADNWNALFADATSCKAEVSLDFGILASEVYPATQRPPQKCRRVGLCPIGPSAIEYHTGHKVSENELIGWWLALVESCRQLEWRAQLFTNGSPEDRRFLKKLSTALEQNLGNDCWSLFEPSSPKELCNLISGLDCLVAYRMHAIIAAYSYDIPCIALKWDKKIDAFFSTVKSEAVSLEVSGLEPSSLCRSLQQLMNATHDSSLRQENFRLLHSIVSRIADSIKH
jgi:polysaccharide pyruvyl transferase WcaK-like protein